MSENRHSILLALLASTWAAADSGVFLKDTTSSLETRSPLVRTNSPTAKCVLLADSQPAGHLLPSRHGLVLKEPDATSKAGCYLHIVLEEPLDEKTALVVTLKDVTFGEVQVNRSREHRESGWISLRLSTGQDPSELLHEAGRLFGVKSQHLFDLRLSGQERSQPAKVRGNLSIDDLGVIKRTVYTMAQRSILERLPVASPDTWLELLTRWPGRHPFEVTVEGRQAAVYYAPGAGYQLEKIDGRWTIVGG